MAQALTMLLSALALLQAASDVVPLDAQYYTADVRNTQLIFTRDNLAAARRAAEIESCLQPYYEHLYGYTMDETLYVGLASENNQIANGFSTPYPNNRQINYGGGVLKPDYFAATSWLDTLLFHETAHNYQGNAKANPVSSGLHAVLGNGSFFFPWFTLPNIVESSFLLEGNAVLNESRFGNGGRLYSGRFKAATLQQARAGHLTPERVYNDNYYFLYGSHFYTLGGYYNSYLAETYGAEKTNAYWLAHSEYWFWPFVVDAPTRQSIGKSFDETFTQWREAMEAEAVHLKESDGEAIASTQFFSAMNDDDEAIYFIINETGRGFPELISYDKQTHTLTRTKGSWIQGKVVRTHEGYATQASHYVNPWRIRIGLYDDEAFLIDGTASSVVEGYLRDGTPVRFDVPSSYETPHLYLGTVFYDVVNSSVYLHGDDLYYFKQQGKTRTLYRNRTPLLLVEGYYGHPVGVDSGGAVYFIANTAYGSGLFRVRDGQTERLSEADTLFDARLIDDTHALVAEMGADAYRFKVVAFAPREASPYTVTLTGENSGSAAFTETCRAQTPHIGTEHPYFAPTQMHYSGTDLFLGSDSSVGLLFALQANFADPLLQNGASVFASRGLDGYTLAGAGYTNSQTPVTLSLTAYGVADRPDDAPATDRRDYGVSIDAALPFWRQGRYEASLLGAYYEEYTSNSRKPLSLSLLTERREQYGVSAYPNFLLTLKPYVAVDRGDAAYGASGSFRQGLGAECYLGAQAQYSRSDAAASYPSRGIKLTRNLFAPAVDGDPSSVIMPSLDQTLYLRSAAKGGLDLFKVFNFAAYYFTFPLSLRREALTLSVTRYTLEGFNGDTDATESSVGITFDTFWFNKLPIPIQLRYYHNNNDRLAEPDTIRITLGITY